MNNRLSPSSLASLEAPTAAASEVTDPAHERALIRVDRAQTELRHGRAVLVSATADITGATPASLQLVLAVETLGEARMRWLVATAAAGGHPLRLLLTAERLRALGFPDASTPRVHGGVAGLSVARLQELAAVLRTPQALAAEAPGPMPAPELDDPDTAGPALLAAVTLAKRARLTPALLVVELDAAAAAALDAQLPLALLRVDAAEVDEVQRSSPLLLQRVSDAHVPIAAHEDCTLVLFRELHGDAEHVAVLVGQPDLAQPVPVRLHSSCLTGDLLGSLRCDCGDQLRRAAEHLAESGGGVILYLAQEGRGTGLASKLRAYRLQDSGLDTLDADRHLGFRADERDFRVATAMLRALGIERVRLLTNNPAKLDHLRRTGIEVVDRVPLIAPVNPHNARYIQTKRERAGHMNQPDSAAAA